MYDFTKLKPAIEAPICNLVGAKIYIAHEAGGVVGIRGDGPSGARGTAYRYP